MTMMMKLVPVFAIAALLFAVYLAMKVSRQEAGTKKMKEISDAISEGARAFLMAEYKILVVFVIVLFVLIGVGTRSIVTAICFVAGAAFSTLAGYFGMQMATKANEPGAFYCVFRWGSYGTLCGWSWRSWCKCDLPHHRGY